ncbi:hypothetical protein [Ekhidna sp. To15]|uniref:hypothetical protein n=1 Tax=Ekhidna sp. To15 TaxID=3395267 RepID=UPI003F51CCD9
MKKHHLAFASLLGFALLWCYCLLLPVSELFALITFSVIYLGTLSILMPIALFNRSLNRDSKIGWLVFGLILTPVLPLIFYFKYQGEIQRIIETSNKKMKSGSKSLSEFDSRSD